MGQNVQVLKGAEHFYLKGNNVGILISHGFMGTPQSVRYLGEELAKFGYSIYAPRLKGHGTDYYDLETCSHEDWFVSLEEGYQFLKGKCSKVFIVGQSMGGTLTLNLANKYRDVDGIILINPALSIPTLEYVKGKTDIRFIDEGEPDIKAADVHEITYEKAPVKSIQELQELMEQTLSILANITCPVLGIKSSVDHVVPPENTELIMNQIGSENTELITLLNSYHVASMDQDKHLIVERCHQFILKQLSLKLKAM